MRWPRAPSSWRHLRLLEGDQLADARARLGPGDDHLAGRRTPRGDGCDDVIRSRLVLLHEVPAVAGHHGLRHDGARVVEVNQVPGVARLTRADVGEVRSRALRA